MLSVSASGSQKSRKSPIHYECWVQDRPYLKNYKSHKKKLRNSKSRFRELRIYNRDDKKNWFILSKWLNIFEKIAKIRKLIYHSFQNIAHLMGRKKLLFKRGEGGLHAVNVDRALCLMLFHFMSWSFNTLIFFQWRK